MVAAEGGNLLGCTLEQFEAFMRERSDPTDPYRAVPRSVDIQSAGEPTPDLRFTLQRPDARVLQRSLRYSEHRQAALTLYFRDITREVEVERMKSEFLSTAAHELRTPMASIMGFSELLLHREYPRERQRDMLSTINRQSQRLTNLLNELLDLARIEARQGKDFKRVTLTLGPWLRETIASYMAPNDPRRVEALIPDDLPDVEADRDKLQQALFNVISNAYKYSPGGGEIRLDTLDHDYNGERFVGLRVSDQGLGMSPEQQSHLFERFWRADTTGHIPGTGLGMSLVKEILELHGGYVEVASQEGHGTQVTLWLPARKAEQEKLALAA
jgi:signal transduction histidine kinase